MRSPVAMLAVVVAAMAVSATAGCGDQIGDSCQISSDCSAQGDRFCDTTQPGGGYCTVVGCDHGTCPEEAVCVRFFPVGNNSIVCDPQTEDLEDGTDQCSLDEVCTLGNYCAPRSAEQRFCMKTCENSGDCREQYECRDRDLMLAHGGEPVPPAGERVSSDPQPFCAAAPHAL
jgi:hypothetical protein